MAIEQNIFLISKTVNSATNRRRFLLYQKQKCELQSHCFVSQVVIACSIFLFNLHPHTVKAYKLIVYTLSIV